MCSYYVCVLLERLVRYIYVGCGGEADRTGPFWLAGSRSGRGWWGWPRGAPPLGRPRDMPVRGYLSYKGFD